MSTSLKVVSMAAVFWACFRRSAMRRRRRVIGTRSSLAVRARGTCGTSGCGVGRAAGACGAGEICGAAGFARCAVTSPLVRRPSLPVPATAAGSTLFSATILRTAGDSVSAAGFAAGAGAAGCAQAGARRPGAGLTGAAAATAPSVIWPITAPIATTLPSGAVISPRVPAVGA